MFVIAISLAATAMERQEKRLAKYSRYNASQKGRERVERYRATPASVVLSGPFKGQVAESKGMRNRSTSYIRRLRAGILAKRAQIEVWSAELGVAPDATYTEVVAAIMKDYAREVAAFTK